MTLFDRRQYADKWEVESLKQRLDIANAEIQALKTFLGVETRVNDPYRMVETKE